MRMSLTLFAPFFQMQTLTNSNQTSRLIAPTINRVSNEHEQSAINADAAFLSSSKSQHISTLDTINKNSYEEPSTSV